MQRNHDTEKRSWDQENMKLKQEACRPDSSVFIIGFLATKIYQKPVQTLRQITHLASRKS